MKATTVDCQKCGAPLEIEESVRFLTCRFCSSRLEVLRDGSATLTAVRERAEQLEGEVEDLRQQLDLETLEREWAEETERHAAYSENGRSIPDGHPHMAAMIGYVLSGVLIFAGVVVIASEPPNKPGQTSATETPVEAPPIEIPDGWTGPHYKNDGREFIQGPEGTGLTGGTPIKYTGRRAGVDVPVQTLHQFHPLREKLEKRRGISSFGGFLVLFGSAFLVIAGATHVGWKSKVDAFAQARDRYEQRKQEILARTGEPSTENSTTAEHSG